MEGRVMILEAMSWARRMFGSCDLGDRRREERLVLVGAMLAQGPGQSLVKASGGDEAAEEGAYRLIRNRRVGAEEIAEGAYTATLRAALETEGDLVMCGDTTTLAFAHASVDGLGDLGGPEASPGSGWQVHHNLLVSVQGKQVLGLSDQEWWVREPKKRGKRNKRKDLPYEEKESRKWEASVRRSAQRLGPEVMKRVVCVSDRESDVYEYLAYQMGAGHRFVVRVGQDRALLTQGEAPEDESEQSQQRRLCLALSGSPELGRITVDVPQRGGRPARQAEVALRAREVELRPPPRSRGPKLASLKVNAVLVQEVDAPQGQEPLSWMLYTSEPIDTPERVAGVMGLYTLRWRVEDYHKCWKSGTKVEDLRLQSRDNLRRMGTILAHVAVRILELHDVANHLVESKEQAPVNLLMPKAEWQCLWKSVEKGKPLPLDPPTMAWAVKAVARLGGWNDSKRTGRMGYEALWSGWSKLQERLIGWHLARGDDV
jgi:hypothetical protein